VWHARTEQDARFWLRVLIIGAALVLSAALAPGASTGELGVLLSIAAVAVFIRWPTTGLAALLVCSALLPFTVSTATQSSVNVSVILVVVLTGLWVLEMIVRRDLYLLPSRPIAALLALCVVAGLAFIKGFQPWLTFAQIAPLPARLGGLAIVLLSVAVFLLMAHRVRNMRTLQYLTWLFVALAAMFMIRRVTGLPLPPFVRGADGSMLWLWLVALAFSQALLNRDLAVPWRALLMGLVGVTLYAGVVQNRDWNSGWVPGSVALLVILWAGAPRLALVATLVGGAALLLNAESLANALFFQNAYKQYDVLTRTAAWSIVWDIIRVEPILGIGFANYYWYTELFPILGYYIPFNSHNNYLDLTAQMGVVGLACFAWFSWEACRLGWRLRQHAPAGFARAYVCGGLGGLAGMLVAAFLGDWVLPFVYNIGLTGFRASLLGWFFLGGLVVVEQISLANQSPTTFDRHRQLEHA
jgi:hypothetical protein